MQTNDPQCTAALRAAYPRLAHRCDDYLEGVADALLLGPVGVASDPHAPAWLTPHLWDRSQWERDYASAVHTAAALAGRITRRERGTA